MTPLVSIIIPAKSVTPYLRENIAACLRGAYKNFEIIVVLDEPTKEIFPKTIFLVSGPVGPAKKRDIGARGGKGTVLAFIDDDVIPSDMWLSRIMKTLRDPKVGAVGGPGVTPHGVPWQEEASGWVSASPVGSGGFLYRFLPMNRREVDDYPSMNLAVRRSDFEAIGGFDSQYWPGEDTKLCHDIVYTLGKKIIYEPEALVYHHRRPLWLPHLRQNGNFGIHRGYFARILPKTSARPLYFLPSVLVLAAAYAMLYPITRYFVPMIPVPFSMAAAIAGYGFGGYFVLLIANGVWIAYRSKRMLPALVSVPAVFATHVWYGLRFLQGYIFTKKLTT